MPQNQLTVGDLYQLIGEQLVRIKLLEAQLGEAVGRADNLAKLMKEQATQQLVGESQAVKLSAVPTDGEGKVPDTQNMPRKTG